jgi:type IV pilus assembly protein PilQ
MKKSIGKRQYKIMLFSFLAVGMLSAVAGAGDRPPNSDSMIPMLNFRDADVRDVFRGIAYEYQTNITVEYTVAKRVTIALFNVSVFDAVHIITEDNNLAVEWDNRRFYIKSSVEVPQTARSTNPPEIQYANDILSIESRDVPVDEFIDSLGRVTGKNILLTAGTSGSVTGRISNLPFETGFGSILKNNGFHVHYSDGIHFVSRSYYTSRYSEEHGGHSQPFWISIVDGKITMDVNGASLGSVLNELSDRMGFPLVMFEEPVNLVSARGIDLSLQRVFSFLFRGTEFTFKEDDGMYYVGKKDQQSLHNVRLMKLKYLRASNVKDMIPETYLRSVRMSPVLEHNGLVVTGPEEYVGSLIAYIEELDQPVAQVLIEALVVDYNVDKSLEYGITAGKGETDLVSTNASYSPHIDVTGKGRWLNEIFGDIGKLELFNTGVGVDFGRLGKLPNSFYVNLKALEERGLVNIRSRPVLSAINGHTASLEIGTIQNYVFTEIMPFSNITGTTFIEKEVIESIEAKISFEITPWVGPNGNLTLEIKPEFQTPVGQFTPDKRFIPAINTRTFQSTVSIKDGETIILGGLIQETEIDVESRVPILGSIPLLGKLFRSVRKESQKSELVVYITPRIDYGGASIP